MNSRFTIYDLRLTRRRSRREEANSRSGRPASLAAQPIQPSAESSSSPGGEGRGEGGCRPTNFLEPSRNARINSKRLSNSHSAFRIPRFASFFLFPFSFFLLALLAPAQSTNDSSTSDFSSFQVIVDRNIFNPDRYGRQPRIRHESYGVPTFSLAGTMSYRKGMFAFFDGTSGEYRKALQQGGKIAGYTVEKISFDGVQLQSSGITIGMKVGSAMRLEGGAWQLSAPGDWGEMGTTDSTTGNGAVQETSETSTNLPSSGEESDALKRLMERRKQLEQDLK